MSEAELARLGVLSSVEHCFKTREYVGFSVGAGPTSDGSPSDDTVLMIRFRSGGQGGRSMQDGAG